MNGLAPTLLPLLFIQEAVDFDSEVRPLLADRCFSCHGPDEGAREAGLRLDTLEGATEDRGGYAALVPGDPQESELLLRIESLETFEVMPPPESHRPRLNAEEIAVLRRWIRAGAPWSTHWSLTPPERPALLPAFLPDHGHPIDQLVRQRLASEGLDLAPPAPTHTLLRRLALDLTGLPPAPAEVAALRSDPSDDALNSWIDTLLASPHHAERLALWWLDSARYSDTDGFQADAVRTSWPWRDWVIDAFAANMRFDQFTLEQIAGDLLPEATERQRLATSFHRNHMANGEGGRIAEESRIDYVQDRVNTTGTLWLGLTLGCAQCHDHKFDPISQRDYYRLAAYFNSIDETGAAGGSARPTLTVRSAFAARALEAARDLHQRTVQALEALRSAARAPFEQWIETLRPALDQTHSSWRLLRPRALSTQEGGRLTLTKNGSVQLAPDPPEQDDYHFTSDSPELRRITGIRLEVFSHLDHTQGAWSFAADGEFLLTGVKVRARQLGAHQVREASLVSAVADVEGVAEDDNYRAVSGALDDDPRTGWTLRGTPRDTPHVAVFALEEPLILDPTEELEVILLQRSLFPQALMGRFKLFATDEGGAAVRAVGPTPREELATLIDAPLPGALHERLFDQYLEESPRWRRAQHHVSRTLAQRSAAERASGDLQVLVLAERAEPRATHILNRGVWDDPGEPVSPGVPAAVLARDDSAVPTRLELARWLVDPANPLTARAIVNQLWQMLFGAGLIRTPEDLGLRGARPQHPELLDWLAVELVESGWNLRHILRTIVTSDTYRQDSTISPAMLEHDPDNQLLARGARYRMPSWMIRDVALASSGLLNPARGGPPVFPHQPPGVWADQFMGRLHYSPTLGAEQYRRTLYAFWRRNSAPAFLFDTTMRRECEVGVRRTNTPLHALTLLNDRTALEAARALALQALPGSSREVVWRVFERVLLRYPQEQEARELLRYHAQALEHYLEHPEDADSLLHAATPALPRPPDPSAPPPAEIAAGTLLASLVFNLDEAVTHE